MNITQVMLFTLLSALRRLSIKVIVANCKSKTLAIFDGGMSVANTQQRFQASSWDPKSVF